jgi:hypothetical protein
VRYDLLRGSGFAKRQAMCVWNCVIVWMHLPFVLMLYLLLPVLQVTILPWVAR